MSDLPILPTAADEPVDQAFLDLVAKLGPVFNEIAKAAVTESIAAVPTPTFRPGLVQGVSLTERTATVLIDGDTSPITAQVICELPYTGARVMVEFVPPSAVFVVGFVGLCGVPPGSMMPYAGPITQHAGAASSSATPGQPPAGWLWCAGQAVSRSTYSALYAAIGTSAGAGDGATTFNVPDYRGRVFIGLDNMGGSDATRISAANTLLGTGGSNAISQAMLPNVSLSVSGSVSISDPGHSHSIDPPTNGVLYGANGPGGYAGNTINNTGSTSTSGAYTGISGSLSGATASLGGSGSEHLPPYALCHIIIKA